MSVCFADSLDLGNSLERQQKLNRYLTFEIARCVCSYFLTYGGFLFNMECYRHLQENIIIISEPTHVKAITLDCVPGLVTQHVNCNYLSLLINMHVWLITVHLWCTYGRVTPGVPRSPTSYTRIIDCQQSLRIQTVNTILLICGIT